MKLADATPEVRAAFAMGNWPQPVILDPGENSERLGIGKIERGNTFCLVGDVGIRSVRQFVDHILQEVAAQEAKAGDEYEVRVCYNFSNLEMDGTMTEYLKLTAADVADLRKVLSTLPED